MYKLKNGGSIMDLWMLFFIGIIPILLLFLFLIILRWTAKNSMLIAFILVLIITTFIWKVPFNQISAASVNGIETAFNLLYIVFVALVLHNTLKVRDALEKNKQNITGVRHDRRIQ